MAACLTLGHMACFTVTKLARDVTRQSFREVVLQQERERLEWVAMVVSCSFWVTCISHWFILFFHPAFCGTKSLNYSLAVLQLFHAKALPFSIQPRLRQDVLEVETSTLHNIEAAPELFAASPCPPGGVTSIKSCEQTSSRSPSSRYLHTVSLQGRSCPHIFTTSLLWRQVEVCNIHLPTA